MRHFFLKPLFSFALFLVIVFLWMCCKTPNNISPEAEKYLNEVLSLLQKNSVNKQNINWNNFRNEVFNVAKNSQTVQDTYPAVAYAIAQLKDNHSYFAKAIQDKNNAEEKPLPVLIDEKTPATIGYIRIPFCIGNKHETEQYIEGIANKINQQNKPVLKGWIIDLRDNFGGNMWPMMAAVGSFFDAGTQGYFFDADNKAVEWRFENGKAYADTTMLAANNHIVSLFGKNKIAVLINSKTASSGEAMAVLFKGYNNARFFGKPSFGVSTGCESFSLSDGSRINLATSVFADRTKRKYGGSVVPHFTCNESETLSAAIKWIDY